MADVSDYIPTREFLLLLDRKVGRTQLNEMLRAGRLDAIRPGGRWFVNKHEVERLLARRGNQ